MAAFGAKRTCFHFLQIAYSVKSMTDLFAEARGFQRGQNGMAKRRNVKSDGEVTNDADAIDSEE